MISWFIVGTYFFQNIKIGIMRCLILAIVCLTFIGCEKEVECCSYNYWVIYNNNNNSSINEGCACCYDVTGRIINCPQ